MSIPAQVKQRQFLELEQIQREELKWEEEHTRSAARISFLKKCKAIHKQLTAATRKQEVNVARAHKTLLRRTDTLTLEEQRGRLHIMQSESLRLEGILRVLEGSIRESIFSAAYDVQQRIKYFNKTVDTMVKAEGQERKATVGSERYDWLVMNQRFDAARLRMLRREVIDKVSADKAAKLAAKELTTGGGSTNTTRRRTADGEEGEDAGAGAAEEGESPSSSSNAVVASPPSPSSSRQRGGAHFRQSGNASTSSRRAGGTSPSAKPRVSARHDEESRRRMLYVVEDHEEGRREDVARDEERARYGLARFLDFITEREARYTRTDVNAEELHKCRTRRIAVTQKQEQQEREELCHLEAVTFQGFQRRLARIRHEDSKLQETEQRRQMGYDQRLQHRYARITLQQLAFVERERNAINELLTVTREEVPVVVQQIVPDATSVSAEGSRERRQFSKKEEAARKQIQQEESTYVHILYAEMVAASGGGDAGLARNRAAQTRREEQDRQGQERLQKKLEASMAKAEVPHKQRLQKVQADKLARAEQQARVHINQDHVDWHAAMTTSLKAASRMCALMPGAEGEETRLRATIASSERNLRDSYTQAFRTGLRPKTKQPPAPLPPPPVDYEKAKLMYASLKSSNGQSPRARRLGGGGMTTINSTAMSGTSPNSANRSLNASVRSTSSSVATSSRVKQQGSGGSGAAAPRQPAAGRGDKAAPARRYSGPPPTTNSNAQQELGKNEAGPAEAASEDATAAAADEEAGDDGQGDQGAAEGKEKEEHADDTTVRHKSAPASRSRTPSPAPSAAAASSRKQSASSSRQSSRASSRRSTTVVPTATRIGEERDIITPANADGQEEEGASGQKGGNSRPPASEAGATPARSPTPQQEDAVAPEGTTADGRGRTPTPPPDAPEAAPEGGEGVEAGDSSPAAAANSASRHSSKPSSRVSSRPQSSRASSRAHSAASGEGRDEAVAKDAEESNAQRKDSTEHEEEL